MKKETKIVYVEPADYFPKRLRKKYKLGEYADDNTTAQQPNALDDKKMDDFIDKNWTEYQKAQGASAKQGMLDEGYDNEIAAAIERGKQLDKEMTEKNGTKQ